jgi:hypothetical protein
MRDKFAEVACWCKHDCCNVDTEEGERKVLKEIGIQAPFYVCEHCECHNHYAGWEPWLDKD